MADGTPTPVVNPRIAPDDVWARVRQDYTQGMPASEACQRHGVGMTALRRRAASEGWRRADQPWTMPSRLDPDDEGLVLEERVGGDLDRIEMRELIFVADRRMMRAVMRGQAAEALRWRRVRLVLEQGEIELNLMAAQEEAIHHQLFGSSGRSEADSTDSADGVFGDPDPRS